MFEYRHPELIHNLCTYVDKNSPSGMLSRKNSPILWICGPLRFAGAKAN